MVPFAQTPQAEVAGAELVHPGVQTTQIAAHKVQLDSVESAGTGCGPEIPFGIRVVDLFGDTG